MVAPSLARANRFSCTSQRRERCGPGVKEKNVEPSLGAIAGGGAHCQPSCRHRSLPISVLPAVLMKELTLATRIEPADDHADHIYQPLFCAGERQIGKPRWNA